MNTYCPAKNDPASVWPWLSAKALPAILLP